MKKIITLLFCVAAMAFAAHAEEDLVQQCINAALNSNPTKLTSQDARFDLNQDGVVDVSDVTMVIKQKLEKENAVVNAPAPKKMGKMKLKEAIIVRKIDKPSTVNEKKEIYLKKD